MTPHRPHDAGELVGESDGGLVVAAQPFELQRPDPEPIRRRGCLRLRVAQHGPRAVNQEHAQVGVAALANRPQAPPQCRRGLPRREPEITREVPPGRKPRDVADRRHQRRGRQQPDPGNCAELTDDHILAGDALELALNGPQARLDLPDVRGRIGQRGPQQSRNYGVGVFQERGHVGYHMVRADRHDEPELAQQAADGVDPRGAGGEPHGAQAVQRRQGLLRLRLDRHRSDIFVPKSFEQSLGVGAIGLVPQHVGANDVRRHQHSAMAVRLGLPRPMMRRAAGLHQHRRRRSLGQKTPEPLARKPLTLPHLAGLLRDRHLEHRFRHVDSDRRTIHGDSSFHRRYGRKATLAHPMPFKSREESIPSLKPTPPAFGLRGGLAQPFAAMTR